MSAEREGEEREGTPKANVLLSGASAHVHREKLDSLESKQARASAGKKKEESKPDVWLTVKINVLLQ